METKTLASKEEILLVSFAHLDLESSKFEEYLNLIFDGLCYSDMDVSYRSSKVYDIRVTFPSISELNQALGHFRKIRNHIVIEKNSECDSLCDVFFETDDSITKNIQAFFRTLFYEANYELQSFCLKTAGEGLSNASVKFRTAEEGYLATEYVLEYVPNCLKQIMVVQKLDHLSEHHLKDEKFENAIVDLVICKKKDGERSVKIKKSAASKIRQEDSSIRIPSLSTAAPEELDILDRGSIIHIQITHSKKSHHGKRLKQHLADILKNFIYSIIKFQWNNSRSAFDVTLKFYNRQEALSAHCFLCTLADYFVIEKCYSNAKAMVLYTKSNIPDEERFRGFLTNVFNGKKFDFANYSRVENYTTAMVVFTNEDDARDATYWFMRRYPRTLNQMLIVDPINFGDSKVITSEKKLQTIPTDGDIIGMTMDKDLGVEVNETRITASDFKNVKNTMKNKTDTLCKNKIEKKSEAKVQEKHVVLNKKKEIKVHGKDGANVPKNSDEKNPKNVLERHPSKDLPKKKKKTLPKEKMAPKGKGKDLLQVDENDNVIEDKNKQPQATSSGITTAEPIQKPSESSVQNEKKTEKPLKKGQRRMKTGKPNVPITSITAAILDSEMRQSKGYFDHHEKPKIKNDQKSNNIPKWHLELGFQSFESDKARFTTYLHNLFYNHDFEVTNFKHDPRLSLNNIEVKFPDQKSAQEFTDLVLDLPITRGLSVIIIGEVRRSDLTLPIGFVEDFSGLVYKDLLSRLLEDKLKFKFQMHYGKNNLTLVFHRKGDAKAAVPLILQMIPFLPPALRISTIGMSNQVFFNTAYPPDGKPYRPEDAAASPLLPASKKLEVKRQYDAVSRHFKIRSSKTNKKEMVFVPVTYTISQNHPKHITSALKEAFKPFRFRTTDFQRPNRRLNKVRMGFGSKKSARTVSNFFNHYKDTEVSQSESVAKSFEKDAFYDDEFESLPNLSSKWNKKANSIMKKQRAQAKLQRKFNRNRSKKLDRIIEVGKITSRSRHYVSPRIITDISVTRSTTDNEVFEKEFRKLMDGYDFEILGIHNIGNINRIILEFPSFAEEKNAKEYINDLIDGYKRLGKVIPGKAIDEETISEKSLRPLHREPYEFRVPLLDGHR